MMYEFIEYVLYELKNSLMLCLLALIGALCILAASYVFHRKRYKGERQYPWGKALLWLVFVGYIAILLYATMLRGTGGFREWNLHFFRAWREAWNNYTAKNWANVLLNVAMFGPLGFLLPLLGKNFRKWYLAIPTGFGISLTIELLQLATARGICDVDDLFANTLGTAMGFFLVMSVLSTLGTKGRRLRGSLQYGGLFLACTGAICSIFFAYSLKEYGNLPMAAAYTNDTGGTSWTLACELPVVESTVPVYQTQTRSIGACDAFAQEFKKLTNAEFDDISYYQEAAYYMDHSVDENGAHFLFLSYLDPSYEYRRSMMEDPVWVMADRKTIEAAMRHYPCLIPEYAAFTAQEDGWHTFTVDQHADGAVMVDGQLRCRYAEDGIREIENNLLTYTYYDCVAILSPEEAYSLLKAGKWNDGGYFESKSPREICVLACTFGYEIDTKGFYQPVYYFDVESTDGTYGWQLMIPAMGS